ncbi:hypothetical protein [Candidatus Palauibacter sp.]|uniref:hypothetical protein n=1 Tax=Candidatus Palauibacter sp. TaxID=3101350 RepID=UPI003B023EEB
MTELTIWATDTVALPETAPAAAMIVAVPLPAAVTSPDPLTVAIEVALVDQVTAAPAITCPFADFRRELHGGAQRRELVWSRA